MAMICKRCGAEFDDPYPEIMREGKWKEIATPDWCARCNAVVMATVFRESSAYWVPNSRPNWQNEASRVEQKKI